MREMVVEVARGECDGDHPSDASRAARHDGHSACESQIVHSTQLTNARVASSVPNVEQVVNELQMKEQKATSR